LQSAAEGDFAARALRRGYFVYETPHLQVVHHGFRSWEDGRALIRRYWYGAGAMLAKPVKCGEWPAWRLLPRLAWRWAFGSSSVAASLGSQPHRWLRLAAFLSGFQAGILTPVDRGSGHYAPHQ
jgi:hypothetical protein